MKRFLRTLLPVLLITAPMIAAAQIKLLPPCTATGDCGITDILAVFLNVAEFLLGISGAVALGFFVYGGFRFILSRGSKGEVDAAFGILRSAAVGLAIIFLSGVLVRFTTQALTGGQSAIPVIGEQCDSASKKSSPTGDGLWVSIPAGKDAAGNVIPETLLCVKLEKQATKAGDKCANLNGVLKDRNVKDNSGNDINYTCQDISGPVSSCVRGLCSQLSAQYACCVSASAPTPPKP